MWFLERIGNKYGILVFISILVFTIASNIRVNAQQEQDTLLNSQYVYQVWNNKNGLPQNSVQDIIEDDQGYLWIGTEEGLLKFDGYDFQIINQENTDGLYSHWFYDLEPSINGGLWAASRNTILFVNKGSIKAFDFREHVKGTWITSISEDPTGTLWVGTNTGELYYLQNDLQINQWNFTEKKSVQVLKNIADGLLIGTTAGLFKLQYESKNISSISGFDSLNIRSLAIDHDQAIWIGTKQNGLFHKKADKTIHLTEADGLNELFITGLSVAPNGSLWIGTSSSGLQVYHRGQFTTLEEKELTTNGVRNIFFTTHDIIWLGTPAYGLVQLKPADIHMLTKKAELSEKVILPIYEHSNGDIWIGTAASGANRISNGKTSYYTRKNGLTSNLVLSIYGTKDAVYIGTANGMHRFNLASEKIDRHYTMEHGLKNNIIQAIYEDVAQTLWISTRSGGIHKLDVNGNIEQIKLPPEFSDAEFINIFEDSKNNIWFGSTGSGIIVINPENEIIHYSTDNGLPSNMTLSFYEDLQGTIWIGTEIGLVCYDNNEFKLFNKSNGLKFNGIYRIINDGAGYLWLSGNFGLQQIPINELEKAKNNYSNNVIIPVRLFNTSDGMANAEANGGIFPAGWKMSDGSLWFPTIEGVAIVQPELINNRTHSENVYIKSLRYGNKEHKLVQGITVPPGVFNFTIDYSCIDFINPQSINYSYRLKGLNDKWENVGNRRTAYFTSLEPGNYTFEVKAEQFGNWSEASALSFTVKPFFYQTIWFKGILFALLLTIIFFILKYYSKYQQEATLKALVDERTKDLKESNERFRYVTKATNEAIWDYDLLANTVFWGEGYNILFGHKCETYGDVAMWSNLLHPEDKQRVVQDLDKATNSSTNRWSDEYRFLKANGEYALVQDKAIIIRNRNGKATRMIGAMQDVTRQKEAEQHRKLLESVVTHANDGVIITDARQENPIIFVNEAMTKISGFSKEKLVGNSLAILHGPKTDIKEIEKLNYALQKGESCEIEVIEYKKNKEEIWINHSIAPIINENDQITHWIITVRDVTERKEHVKAIEHQNIKLKAIAWTQSHIVRAPLAKMIGYIDLIENYDTSKFDINLLLNHIKSSGVELDTIIKDIVNRTEIVKRDLKDK